MHVTYSTFRKLFYDDYYVEVNATTLHVIPFIFTVMLTPADKSPPPLSLSSWKRLNKNQHHAF